MYIMCMDKHKSCASFQVLVYGMFVAIMAFHAKISDPTIGGTYMTLLNTVANMAGQWCSTVALWFVDPLSYYSDCEGTTNSSLDCSNSPHREVSIMQIYIL